MHFISILLQPVNDSCKMEPIFFFNRLHFSLSLVETITQWDERPFTPRWNSTGRFRMDLISSSTYATWPSVDVLPSPIGNGISISKLLSKQRHGSFKEPYFKTKMNDRTLINRDIILLVFNCLFVSFIYLFYKYISTISVALNVSVAFKQFSLFELDASLFSRRWFKICYVI